jgi:hypothetical protein
VTEPKPSRGPDFLPYPLPQREIGPAVAVAEELPAGSRWQQALEGLTPGGLVAVSLGIIAFACLLGLSLPGHRQAGAVLAGGAALGALGTGFRALSAKQPPDSDALVKGGMGLAVLSALVALLLLATHRSSVAQQPPVLVPQPQATSSPAPQQPSPSPSPAPSPSAPGSAGSPTPGVTPGNGLGGDIFGVPSEPGGAPVSDDPAAKGMLLGRVVNLSGLAVGGATVTITRGDPTDVSANPPCPLRTTTTTDARGNYQITLCQLGDDLGYHVVITSGTAQAATDLYVNSGQQTVYNVILSVRHA